MLKWVICAWLCFNGSAGSGAEARHGLLITLKAENGLLVVEAFFDDDTAAANAKVTLSFASGELVLEGVTDQQGRWEVDHKLASGEYRVVVNAGAGHRAERRFKLPLSAPGVERAPEPTREELTRTPWIKIAIGLGAILLFALAVRHWPKQRQRSLVGTKLAKD